MTQEELVRGLTLLQYMVPGPDRPLWTGAALRAMSREALEAAVADNYRRRGMA